MSKFTDIDIQQTRDIYDYNEASSWFTNDIEIVDSEVRSLYDINGLSQSRQINVCSLERVTGLRTLHGSPISVNHYRVDNCEQLITLKGMSKKVNFRVSLLILPAITDLQGMPVNLKYALIQYTGIKSIKGCPKKIDELALFNNSKLKDLDKLWKYTNSVKILRFDLISNLSTPHELLRIPNLKSIQSDSLEFNEIINTYLPVRSMSDIMHCARRLKQYKELNTYEDI